MGTESERSITVYESRVINADLLRGYYLTLQSRSSAVNSMEMCIHTAVYPSSTTWNACVENHWFESSHQLRGSDIRGKR